MILVDAQKIVDLQNEMLELNRKMKMVLNMTVTVDPGFFAALAEARNIIDTLEANKVVKS